MAEYKNAEGYADPTAFGALCAIEKEEKSSPGIQVYRVHL